MSSSKYFAATILLVLVIAAGACRSKGTNEAPDPRLASPPQLAGTATPDPTDPAVLQLRGRALLAEQRYREAFNLLQRSLAATTTADPARPARLADLETARAQLPRRTAKPDMPNVVMVVIDTLRADHVHAYGYDRQTTPNIDALARGGAVFEAAVSQAPWTAASVASLFTGLYPAVHGLDGGVGWGKGLSSAGGALPFAVQKTLRPGQPTLAEALRANGYQTAGFVSNVYMNAVFGFSQGFDSYNDDHEDYAGDVNNVKRRAEVTNRAIFRWLETGPAEPFFLLVHYNDPHWPYTPPFEFTEFAFGYRGRIRPEMSAAVAEIRGESVTTWSAEDLAYIVALYDGEIAYTDHHLGKLFERLAAAKLARPQLTVITADHGEEFLDHGSLSHGYSLYEEVVHVPLVIDYPGRIEARRIPAVVRLIDVMPTLLELVGADDPPADLQGQSLVPLLTGAGPGPDAAFSGAALSGDLVAVRTSAGSKLILQTSRPTRLFDLAVDPKETDNLFARSPAVATALGELLVTWGESNHALRDRLATDDDAPAVVLDAETIEKLRGLGYVD